MPDSDWLWNHLAKYGPVELTELVAEDRQLRRYNPTEWRHVQPLEAMVAELLAAKRILRQVVGGTVVLEVVRPVDVPPAKQKSLF